jgi:hypothetical protein
MHRERAAKRASACSIVVRGWGEVSSPSERSSRKPAVPAPTRAAAISTARSGRVVISGMDARPASEVHQDNQ